MRIGVMCLASFGGSARIATQLAVQLAKRGHRVHLFSRTIPFGDKRHSNGLTWHTVTPDREAHLHPAQDLHIFLSRVLDVIAVEGLDVLHFHYAVPFASIAAEVKRRLGRAAPLLIGTLHGTDVSVHGRDPVKSPSLAQTLRDVDQLTTVSNSHARLATDVFGLATRPQVIPNFVDLSKFQLLKPHAPIAGGSGAERPLVSGRGGGRVIPRIAHVSNFRRVKDPQSMARIFLSIREQMEAELWLIGEGPEMDAVKSILGRSPFERDVRYWRLRHDVAWLLAQTDLLLMTSLSESFCLAALEAMACGVPVLATEVGGLPEVVAHGETGFLFPVGEHDLAVRLALSLLSDQVRHQAMSEAAARRAARFGFEQVVPLYEDLYRRLLVHRNNRIPLPTRVASQRVFA
jgi:N-acetyl-alpha-D-glucosaminyl L-malate synthase BshA